MKARARCAILLVVFYAFALAAAAETLTFVPVDIPGTPYGLNNAGQIVGTRLGGESTTSYLYTGALYFRSPCRIPPARAALWPMGLTIPARLWELSAQVL